MSEITSFSVTGLIEKENFITTVTAGDHQLFLDEPASLGGQNKGVTPYEMLASSLAGCTLITLKMYLNRKSIDLGTIKVHIQLEPKKMGTDLVVHIHRTITIGQAIEQELWDRLLYIADVCPISKVLKSGNNIIETELKLETA